MGERTRRPSGLAGNRLFAVCRGVVVGCLLAVPRGAEAGGGELMAGAAARVVNPTRPAATVGHRVPRRFTNVYQDIRVQAFALEDASSHRLVWMGCDFCLVPGPVVDRIKQQIREKHAIEPKAICINSSHTHSAPPLSELATAGPEQFDPEYADFVVREAVAVVGDCLARLAPAKVRYVEDTCRLGINRRLGEPGRIRFGPNPEGAVDRRVQIVAAESAGDGRLIGVAVKYACHPVTCVNVGLGSDYPGYMRRLVEDQHPGAVVVFLQGCGANVDSQVGSSGLSSETLERLTVGFGRELATEALKSDQPLVTLAEAFGRELAGGVRRALKKPGTRLGGPIEAEYTVIDLPMQKVPAEKYEEEAKRNTPFAGAWGKTYSGMLARGDKIPETWPYRIQAFRLGGGEAPFTLVALDGEVFCQYGLNLGRMLQPATTVVLGYSNGVVTYLPTAEALVEGGYEPSAYRTFRLPGPYTGEVESMVLQAAADLARPKPDPR